MNAIQVIGNGDISTAENGIPVLQHCGELDILMSEYQSASTIIKVPVELHKFYY